MESLRNRFDVKLASNKKDYLIWTSKPSYMLPKMFDNDLVAISKSKVTLTRRKKCPYSESVRMQEKSRPQ